MSKYLGIFTATGNEHTVQTPKAGTNDIFLLHVAVVLAWFNPFCGNVPQVNFLAIKVDDQVVAISRYRKGGDRVLLRNNTFSIGCQIQYPYLFVGENADEIFPIWSHSNIKDLWHPHTFPCLNLITFPVPHVNALLRIWTATDEALGIRKPSTTTNNKTIATKCVPTYASFHIPKFKNFPISASEQHGVIWTPCQKWNWFFVAT